MKRQQTVEKIIAYASEFGKYSAHVLVPKQWVKQRVVVMTKERYDELREKGRTVVSEEDGS